MIKKNKPSGSNNKLKKLTEALRQSEEKWGRLFQILPVGVSILDSRSTISDMNPALENILGITKEKLLAGDYRKRRYIHADSTPMLPEEFPSFRAVKEQKIIEHVEIGVVKEDGSIIWTDVSAAPMSFPNATCVIVTSDITARKKSEDMLKVKLAELEKINNLLVGREIRMMEMKKEIAELKAGPKNKQSKAKTK